MSKGEVDETIINAAYGLDFMSWANTFGYAEEDVYQETESVEIMESESETETEAPPEIKPDDEVSTEDIVLYSEGVVVLDMDTGPFFTVKIRIGDCIRPA